MMRFEVALLLVTFATTIVPDQEQPPRATPRVRTGVIVGRVLDASNQPVPDVLVVPLSETPSRHGKTIHPFDVRGGSTTNANGEFRVEHLFAGSYYLAALPQNVPRERRLSINSDEHRFGYAITYYPAAMRIAEAKRIEVANQPVAAGNITLASAHLAQIKGIAIASNGQPAHGGRLAVTHGDHLFGVDSIAVPIGPDGSFVIIGVPPGTYHLQLREGQWPPPRDVIPKVSVAKVTVSDGDVRRVRVMPIEMVKATGRLILNASQRALLASGIRVSGVPVDVDGNPGPTRGGTVNDDLTFEFRAWPARGYIRVFVGRQEWTTKAVRLNGIDLGDRDIDFQQGREISGLEIELGKPLSR
jgi:hypothetical protein